VVDAAAVEAFDPRDEPVEAYLSLGERPQRLCEVLRGED
jgi:hypothetical protein